MARSTQELLERLISDPTSFEDSGEGDTLLEKYLAGHPIESLRPLLRHRDPGVQRVAVWIVSELGMAATPLVSDVLPLLRVGDRFLSFHALEVMGVCAFGERVGLLGEVLAMLEHDDEVLRRLAMFLIGNTDTESLVAFQDLAGQQLSDLHAQGLGTLASELAQRHEEVASDLLGSEIPLLRRYGAILARRRLPMSLGALRMAATSSDGDVREYGREIMELFEEGLLQTVY